MPLEAQPSAKPSTSSSSAPAKDGCAIGHVGGDASVALLFAMGLALVAKLVRR